MNFFNRKHCISSIISVSSASIVALNPCCVKANLNIDLDQISNDLENYEEIKFNQILNELEKNFMLSNGSIIELDKSWDEADPVVKYLYYKVLNELLEIPIFKAAVKDLNGVMSKKLTLATARNTCEFSYTPSSHTLSISHGYKPLNIASINEQLDYKNYLKKFNNGEFFYQLQNPNKVLPSDRTTQVDTYVSNRMLSMTRWDKAKRKMATLVNTIIHESGHILHEFLIRGDHCNGVLSEKMLEDVGLLTLYDWRTAGWELSRLRSARFVDIQNSYLVNFINYLVLANVMREKNKDVYKNGETIPVSEMSFPVYDYGAILNKNLSKNAKLDVGHLSGRAMDDSCEFMAELWVATVGCGVRKNSWGETYREYLKMIFGDDCLGKAGSNWYSEKDL